MPTPLKCSNCGAPLHVPDGQRRILCTYCGATSELPVDPPMAPRPTPPAPSPRPRVEPTTSPPEAAEDGGGGLAVAGASSAAALFVGAPVLLIVGAAFLVDAIFDHMQWNGNKTPLLLDIDGDGGAEVVGLVRFLGGDDAIAAVAAFDEEDGGRLWVTRLDTELDLHLAAVGNRLWLADGRGRLRVLDPATGVIVTEQALGEKAEGFCGDGQGGLVVRLAGRGARAIDVGTAAVTALPQRAWESPCPGGFWSSDPGGTPTTRLDDAIDARDAFGLPDALASAVDVEAVFTVEGGASYLLARRQPGTAVPVVVARDGAGAASWSVDVPSGDLLAAETGAPSTLGVGPGRVYVPWALEDGDTPNRVSAFDAATGARLWDATLPDDAGDVEAIVSDGVRVYVSTWTWLRVLDVSSGELLYTVGRW